VIEKRNIQKRGEKLRKEVARARRAFSQGMD
jgi:hypothetical protein